MTWTGGEGVGGGDVGVSAPTGGVAEARATRIPVDILEFEDTLFHDNSAVMMPEVPGLDPTADNAPLTGVKAIGMAFLFAALYPERGLLVAGHTATQANIPESFRISRERAAGILYLIQGNVGSWSATCAGRHTVQDYKQILKYINDYEADWKDGNWACDPGDIDNNFNDDTEHAFTHFARHFNSDIAEGVEEISPLPFTLGELVLEAADHRLSAQYWRAFYYVYELMVCDFLGKTRAELTALRNNLHWVNDAVKMIGCAHSFQLPDTERGDGKIRSTSNNRVEVLFYQATEAGSTALTRCPTMGTNALHDLAHDCPMWYERHFERNYVGPGDRYAVVYHLKFRYYDRIKKDFQDIPGKVNVKAYKRNQAAGSASEEIPAITQYQNGIHTVRVRFGVENPNPDFTDKIFYFAFEAPKEDDGVTPIVRMIHTPAADQTPTIVNRPDDWSTKTFAEKYQYYDLPMKWFSHNWHTRHESNHANDCAFHEHLKDKRQLKPFGSNVTSQGELLMFSLDDVVLMDSATGHDQNLQDANQAGTAKELCHDRANPGSRVKVFIVDTTNHVLKLWQKPNDDSTSLKSPPLAAPATASRGSNITTAKQERIRIERNLVSGMAPNARIVHFRDGFYIIGDQRTTDQPANWMDLPHRPVVGARKAIRHHETHHLSWDRNVDETEYGYTGDYGMHYFHQMYLQDTHPVSFLIIYISWNAMLDTRGAENRSTWAGGTNPDMNDISNFINSGPYNAMTRWNQKRFFYDEDLDPATNNSLVIKPFYFFDERETFEIPLNEHPRGKDFGKIAELRQVFATNKFRIAQGRAFGGPVRWVCFLVPEATGSWAWSVRGGATAHSAMRLRKSTYQPVDGGWDYQTGGDYTEDGDSYLCFVLAHELGHATSLQDEYQDEDSLDIDGDEENHLSYSQHLIQYSMDPKNEGAMMFANGVPRLRHCWYHLHFLNSQCPESTAPGDHLLKGKKFVQRFERGAKNFTFKRQIGWNPRGLDSPPATVPSIKADIRDPMLEEQQYRLPNFVTVSTAPDLTPLNATLRGKIRVETPANLFFWTDGSAMSDADRDALRDLFVGAADKQLISNLQQKSKSMRRLRLALYDAGDDCSSHAPSGHEGCFTNNQNNYRYNGILVVRVMIGVDTGTPAMAAADAHTRLGMIKSEWDTGSMHYRLTGGPAAFANIFVHFLAGFKEGHAGTDWNYALSFITNYSVTVSTAPDLTTLSPGLRPDISYDNATHKVSYTGTGALSGAQHTELQGLFTGAADKRAMDELYQKTLLTSSNGSIDIAESVTGPEMQAHLLNMGPGETEASALKFLEMWINDKMRSDNTTLATYTLQSFTP